jgi:hypothetical protein
MLPSPARRMLPEDADELHEDIQERVLSFTSSTVAA